MPDAEKGANQTAILELIQDMVKQGESEANIVRTLENLGVDAEKARRLLLLGQADTFALVQSEINKMVKNELQKELPAAIEQLRAENNQRLQLDRTTIEAELRQKYERITNLEAFKTEQSARLSTAVSAAERSETLSKSLEKMMAEARRDIRELKTHSGTGQWQLLNRALLIVGAMLGIASAYFFYMQLTSTGLTIDAVLSTGLVALVAITMMIISSLAV
jgi:hypothetical protein